jgi:NTE family protein
MLPIFVSLLAVAGCATRPINPALSQVDPGKGYRYQTHQQQEKTKENLVVLAFSGGGTRAAAFSYGVLEVLRRTEIVGQRRKGRLLDEVDVITGVSGGSFTALAYGLYGEKLFADYEQRFLKRNVQGELIARFLNPARWGALSSTAWGRSELAAQYYDEVLFDGATFADLDSAGGPFVIATATDISTGTRFAFHQGVFDVLCSDLSAVSLSRAAAASSAVPFVLSPVTINNYGGTCNFVPPEWFRLLIDPAKTLRPAGRAIKHLKEIESYQDAAHRPFIHLVDGGLADNLGMRGVLEVLDYLEALRSLRAKSPFDDVKRIIVFVVNSLSSPKTRWDESERSSGNLEILVKATGVPIDHYSYEAVELLKDIAARWDTLRQIRDSAAFASNKDPALANVVNVPNIAIYAIDVSFSELHDKAEFDYLNDLPTSFSLPPEAVDRLRAAAGKIVHVARFPALVEGRGCESRRRPVRRIVAVRDPCDSYRPFLSNRIVRL